MVLSCAQQHQARCPAWPGGEYALVLQESKQATLELCLCLVARDLGDTEHNRRQSLQIWHRRVKVKKTEAAHRAMSVGFRPIARSCVPEEPLDLATIPAKIKGHGGRQATYMDKIVAVCEVALQRR